MPDLTSGEDTVTGFPGWTGALVSGIFALLASVLSGLLIKMHLENYSKPVYQRHIVRILLMVPIYSVTAWLTYLSPHYALTYELIRSCYEAFVIYEFFFLVLCYLGDSDIERRRALSTKQRMNLLWPFCLYSFNPSSYFFLMDIRLLVNQYVLVRPLTTIIAFILQSRGDYQNDFWFTILNFFSVSVSMYALIQFFLVIRHDIAEYRPLNKFLAVKFVIFMTFWQSIAISIAVWLNMIPDTDIWSAEYIAIQTQSFLLCIEMFLAALWHMHDYCYGYGDFEVTLKTNVYKTLMDCFNPSEYLYDLWIGVKHLFERSWHYYQSRRNDGRDLVQSTDFIDQPTVNANPMRPEGSVSQLDEVVTSLNGGTGNQAGSTQLLTDDDDGFNFDSNDDQRSQLP